MSRFKKKDADTYHADWAETGGRGQVDLDGDSLTWTFVPEDHGNGFDDLVRAKVQSVADYRRDGPRGYMPTAAMEALDRHLGIERRRPASDLDAQARVLRQVHSPQAQEAARAIDDYQAWLRKHS